jgi:hypothetical protein
MYGEVEDIPIAVYRNLVVVPFNHGDTFENLLYNI